MCRPASPPTATTPSAARSCALAPNTDPATFRSSVSLITGEVERFGALRRIALRLPLTRPIPGAPITSRFGVRIDPFLGTPAMHTGIDFRAPTGYPARATADGTVTMAGYNGGYGNMVEVDHGNGITTRYGHLSEIDVTVGQVVVQGHRPRPHRHAPAARPARTSTTRSGSTATPSTRCSTSRPAARSPPLL